VRLPGPEAVEKLEGGSEGKIPRILFGRAERQSEHYLLSCI
jgi:hypothetical protein